MQLKARRATSVRAIGGGIMALVIAGIALFLELWTIVPAPNLPTLALAVIIPELTPWGIAFCFATASIAHFAATGWARVVATFCSALALGCALVPWCLLPSTIARCEREMRLAFDGAAPSAPGGLHSTGSAAQPYSIVTALLGDRSLRSIRTRRNQPVRLRDGTVLRLDVYGPRARGPHPTVIVIYGGAWRFGRPGDSAGIAAMLANVGYTAIAIDYRHVPAYQFPTQIDDVRDAIAAVARNATLWDVDPKRVAILGRSAGAQLALLAAYSPEPVTIRAAVAYYAPTDLVGGYRVPPQPDPADVDRILRAYMGGGPENRMRVYVAASPVAYVRPGLPPTLLIGGGRDELVRLAFAHELRDKLVRHRNRVAALDLPWSNHAFDSLANGTGGQIATFYTRRFLAATL